MKTNRQKTLYMAQLAFLVAVELLMAFTPLGYIHVAGLEITFLTVPVAIGAVILGEGAGALLGLIFGLTSFATCFGSSLFGATLLAISPVNTFITCVITRVLMGYLAAILCKLVKNHSVNLAPFIGSLAAPLLNTILFMSSIVVFFYKTDFIQGFVSMLNATNPLAFVVGFVGTQGVVEAIVCFIIASAVSKALAKATN